MKSKQLAIKCSLTFRSTIRVVYYIHSTFTVNTWVPLSKYFFFEFLVRVSKSKTNPDKIFIILLNTQCEFNDAQNRNVKPTALRYNVYQNPFSYFTRHVRTRSAIVQRMKPLTLARLPPTRLRIFLFFALGIHRNPIFLPSLLSLSIRRRLALCDLFLRDRIRVAKKKEWKQKSGRER